MLNLLLAVASSAMVAIVMRLSSHRVKGGISMLSANYLVCTVLGTGYALAESAPLFSSHFPALANDVPGGVNVARTQVQQAPAAEIGENQDAEADPLGDGRGQ